jgi:hypothetical protein
MFWWCAVDRKPLMIYSSVALLVFSGFQMRAMRGRRKYSLQGLCLVRLAAPASQLAVLFSHNKPATSLATS